MYYYRPLLEIAETPKAKLYKIKKLFTFLNKTTRYKINAVIKINFNVYINLH